MLSVIFVSPYFYHDCIYASHNARRPTGRPCIYLKWIRIECCAECVIQNYHCSGISENQNILWSVFITNVLFTCLLPIIVCPYHWHRHLIICKLYYSTQGQAGNSNSMSVRFWVSSYQWVWVNIAEHGSSGFWPQFFIMVLHQTLAL